MGLPIPLFWTSGDVCPGFHGWIPSLDASFPVCNGFLRFTTGATPADLLVVSMEAEPFSIHTVAHIQCNSKNLIRVTSN